jgi:hypothetical protein
VLLVNAREIVPRSWREAFGKAPERLLDISKARL